MGLIFDQNSARFYESWRRSSQSRAVERSLEKLVVSLLQPEPGQRVLDIGCGTGNHLIMLNKMGLNVSGVDASAHIVQEARSRLGHRSTIKRGMAEDLPFEDNEFDFAVLINTLEFLDDPLTALREAGRVANRKVFIGVYNSLSWNGICKSLQGYFGDPIFGQATLFNLWQIKSLLRLAYGNVPISWHSIKMLPSFIEENLSSVESSTLRRRSPFGFFLGLAATMAYRIKTLNLPIKVKPAPAGQPLIAARTMKELNHPRVPVQENEGSMPV